MSSLKHAELTPCREDQVLITINDDDVLGSMNLDDSVSTGTPVDIANSPVSCSSQFSGEVNSSQDTQKLCVICGDRASGYHYNALSCEGCKGFFRRSITRKALYQCKYGGNCMMDMWMRRKCQACRLRRCRDVGMKEVCLLNDIQVRARKFSKPKTVVGVVSTASNRQLSPVECSAVAEFCVQTSSERVKTPLELLDDDHRQLLVLIVNFQEQFELPKNEDITRVNDLKIGRAFEKATLSDQVFAHMVEMTILVTGLIVEFAKCLPGFRRLSKEDQVVLLKGSSSEVMMLRTARRFDPDTNTVVFGDGMPFSRDCMAHGGLQDYVNCMFDFASRMNQMGVDNAEYALLTAICIFSDRPGVAHSSTIEAVQEQYVNTLCAYVLNRRSNSKIFLARLLMKLVELRTLSIEHSMLLYQLTIERGSLPVLLQEYFDLPKQA